MTMLASSMIDLTAQSEQSMEQSSTSTPTPPAPSKKSRAFGLLVGVRVCCTGAPHPRRVTKYEKQSSTLSQTIEYTGCITRVGTASNGGWFEVALDGENDRRVYFRRGSIKKIKQGKSPSTRRSSIKEEIVQAQPIYALQSPTITHSVVEQFSIVSPTSQSNSQSYSPTIAPINHSVMIDASYFSPRGSSAPSFNQQISQNPQHLINQFNNANLNQTINQSFNQPMNQMNQQSVNQPQTWCLPPQPFVLSATSAPVFVAPINQPTIIQSMNQQFQAINQLSPTSPGSPLSISSASTADNNPASSQFNDLNLRRASTGTIADAIKQSINNSMIQSNLHSSNNSIKPMSLSFDYKPISQSFHQPNPIKVITPRAVRPNSAFTVVS